MKEVIKNTLLLEDHLSSKCGTGKYCMTCIWKHMQLNNAYLSEAIWMSCDKCKDFPKLEESLKFHESIYEQWYANMNDNDTRLNVLTKLRDWRREIVELYYF
jgi:hypothetical protein